MIGDDASKLPDKLYYRIGEVASLVGVEPHVLRYWEREFRTIRPRKSARGQRVYSRRDVETLMRVRELLYSEGFTIAGARRRLQQERSNGGAVIEPAEPAPSEMEAADAALDDDAEDSDDGETNGAHGHAAAAPSEVPRARRSSPSVDRSLPLFDLSSGNGAAAAPMAAPRGRQSAAVARAPEREIVSSAVPAKAGPEVRAMLRELRGEIEMFLDELG